MTGLVDFANSGGRGLSLSADIFNWNHGGESGALDLHDYAMDGDVGYYPDWYNQTVSYLNEEANSDVNVIMWSWCGQVGNKYSDGVLWDEYLGPMSALEMAYPNVVFVYMTGHLIYEDRLNVNAANDSIRSFCRNNGKVLFDFADIESYSPDGTCYKANADDACDYYNTNNDSIGNWAIEYQDSHTEEVDWYNCGAAHSQPLNANLKAYAAWWLFASLGGWNYVPSALEMGTLKNDFISGTYPNPANTVVTIELSIPISRIHQIKLFSASGQLIKDMMSSVDRNDEYSASISTADLKSGIYFLRLVSDTETQNQQLIIAH
jgi:hypothetical protein